MRRIASGSLVFAIALVALTVAASGALAAVDITLPLGRTAYQTNEDIQFAVVRSSNEALAAGNLTLTLTGNDGSQMTFKLPVSAVAVANGTARTTEHVFVDGWLLRPGHYLVETEVDGQLATTEIDVYSHIRKTSYKLINWGRARGDQQLPQGEDSLGFNIMYWAYGDKDKLIQAGVDYMRCCTMSGGHQMDLRMECDWSDPRVVRGGTARVVRQALADRTDPNVLGVHFYDEPGLTWAKDPVTGAFTPHSVPSQLETFKAAFGHDRIPYYKVDPNNPADVKAWKHWAKWKLGFMDAAWQDAQFGVSYVDPNFLSVTQSQYGFSAYGDGYYFNVARSLPVVSGHGGYDDWGCGYFHPSFTLEVARARDLDKPCWYLPTWYGNTPSDRFRLEQYLSFQTNIQGMITPPDLEPGDGNSAALDGIVESNKLMGKLGTIFNTMPVTRPPVAMLFSLSDMIHEQTADMNLNYSHATKHGRTITPVYLAGKLLQYDFMPVVDEDIVDGTVAANHKAIILGSIKYLDPAVIAGLERFTADGGLVLMTSDCTVNIKGAINLGMTPEMPDADKIAELSKNPQANRDELTALTTIGKQLDGARPLAKAIKAQLDKAGIKPVIQCDNTGIAATRQAAGDVEYVFAVNAAFDYETNQKNAHVPTAATITIDTNGRPVYDAVRGGAVQELKANGNTATGTFRFGPGQMRVFALTARPIGSVQTSTPVIKRDYTRQQDPLSVRFGVSVVDGKGALLSGSFPLNIQVIDPMGNVRYDLYRATKDGVAVFNLPLAINEPVGNWQIGVRELLNNTTNTTAFTVTNPGECGIMAGTVRRAVMFGNDYEHVKRFARVHQDVTVVTGSADYHQAAADRIREILAPWGVRVSVVPATEVNKAKPISAEAAKTWVGLGFGRVNVENPSIGQTGFAIDGPVILLGTPQNNPLINAIAKEKFLPYAPKPNVFPGTGRGMVAWQRDAIGHGQESITLIAYDEKGLNEAIGSMYEAVAAIQPLTRWQLPVDNSVSPATEDTTVNPAKVAWEVTLPEKAAAMKTEGNAVTVITKAGTVDKVANGKVVSSETIAFNAIEDAAKKLAAVDAQAMAAAKKFDRPDRLLKAAASNGQMLAVGFYGGTLEIAQGDSVKFQQQLDQDITGLAWLNGELIVGLADGRVLGIEPIAQ